MRPPKKIPSTKIPSLKRRVLSPLPKMGGPLGSLEMPNLESSIFSCEPALVFKECKSQVIQFVTTLHQRWRSRFQPLRGRGHGKSLAIQGSGHKNCPGANLLICLFATQKRIIENTPRKINSWEPENTIHPWNLGKSSEPSSIIFRETSR